MLALGLASAGCAQIELAAEAAKSPLRGTSPVPSASGLTPAGTGEASKAARAATPPAPAITLATAHWDGRPTPGGTWIALPDTTRSGRVWVENRDTGLAGAALLLPGGRTRGPAPSDAAPRLSADLSRLLGVSAGSPATLRIIRLPDPGSPPRPALAAAPQIVAADAAPAPMAPARAPGPAQGPTPGARSPGPIIAAHPGATRAPGRSEAPEPRPGAAPAGPAVQVGLFAVPENAQRLRDRLRAEGLRVDTAPLALGERDFTRVLVRPAAPDTDPGPLLDRLRGAGFTDATVVAG